jgi:hypothetical protein
MEAAAVVCHRSGMSKPTKAEMLAVIRRSRGSTRRQSGDKPFAESWTKHKAEDRRWRSARFAAVLTLNLADRP